MRRILAGDHEGYYEDYRPSVHDLAMALRQGWFFTGQHSSYLGAPRGSDPAGIPLWKFVICLQNHDQVGNRAYGDRLHQVIELPAYRAASALLLFAPETPLLFMGQEWAASSPFLYFTDHATELGRKVVDGRRREFEKFSQFRDPSTREQIPSPQASEMFASSRLDWAEREHHPHLGVWRLYRRCLELRRHLLARPHANEARDHVTVEDCGDDTVVLRYRSIRAELVVVSRLRGAGAVTVAGLPAQASVMLTTEDAAFAPGGLMPKIESGCVTFSTPATVVFAFTR